MRDHLPIDSNAISDYVLGLASSEDRLAIEQWAEKHPSRQQWIRDLESAAKLDQPPELDLDQLCLAIERRTGTPLGGDARGARSRRTWIRIGATAAIAAVAVLGWGQHKLFQERSTQARATSSLAQMTYATASGERATISLPDGSTIVLNVGSRIDIPADYANGHRTVTLTGEALFEVKHIEGGPFTVRAGPSETRVLGTEFAVRYYETDTAATVAVRTGRVMVQSQVLSAEQEITIGTHAIGSIQTSHAARFSFATGVLRLADMKIRDAIPELNRWYNVDIRCPDTILSARAITGGFIAGSAADFAAVMELTYPDIQIKREARTLTILWREKP